METVPRGGLFKLYQKFNAELFVDTRKGRKA
jgi:hypothetical protein